MSYYPCALLSIKTARYYLSCASQLEIDLCWSVFKENKKSCKKIHLCSHLINKNKFLVLLYCCCYFLSLFVEIALLLRQIAALNHVKRSKFTGKEQVGADIE